MQQGQIADCQRSIHKYNSFTQNSMRTIEKLTGKRDPPPDNAYGAIAGRQREEAILVQKLTQHKCITNKVSYTTSFYDSSNAFYCCEHSSVQGYRDEITSELGRNALEQIVENNITVCRTPEGITLLSPKTGVAPGLHNATNMFNYSYNDALQEYYANTKEATSLLNVENPVKGDLISAAHSSFVDDVCSTAASFDHQLLTGIATAMSDQLTKSFEKRGSNRIAVKPPCSPRPLAKARMLP